MALISLLMIYHSYPDILNDFLYPSELDGDNLKQNLMMQTAEIPVIYTTPPVLKQMIGIWSRKRLSIWEELYKTLHYEYVPIHNYDRTDERFAVETRDLTANNDRKIGTDRNLIADQVQNQESTETTKKTGYDSRNPVTSQVVDDEMENTVGTKEDEKVDTSDVLDTQENEQTDNVEHLRAYGNIGVTSTQELIQQQRELVQFDLVQYIIDDFMKEFCIMVY